MFVAKVLDDRNDGFLAETASYASFCLGLSHGQVKEGSLEGSKFLGPGSVAENHPLRPDQYTKKSSNIVTFGSSKSPQSIIQQASTSHLRIVHSLPSPACEIPVVSSCRGRNWYQPLVACMLSGCSWMFQINLLSFSELPRMPELAVGILYLSVVAIFLVSPQHAWYYPRCCPPFAQNSDQHGPYSTKLPGSSLVFLTALVIIPEWWIPNGVDTHKFQVHGISMSFTDSGPGRWFYSTKPLQWHIPHLWPTGSRVSYKASSIPVTLDWPSNQPDKRSGMLS